MSVVPGFLCMVGMKAGGGGRRRQEAESRGGVMGSRRQGWRRGRWAAVTIVGACHMCSTQPLLLSSWHIYAPAYTDRAAMPTAGYCWLLTCTVNASRYVQCCPLIISKVTLIWQEHIEQIYVQCYVQCYMPCYMQCYVLWYIQCYVRCCLFIYSKVNSVLPIIASDI